MADLYVISLALAESILRSLVRTPKKHLQKRRRIFRRDREPSRIPAGTQNV